MKTVLVILTLSFLSLTACRKAPALEPVKAEAAIPVQTQIVQTTTITAAEQYTGEIKADRQAELSFRVSGQLNALYQVAGRTVQAGDFVAAGTVLARLRETEFRAQLNKAHAQMQENEAAQANARATLAKAEAALEHARAQEARAQRLFKADSFTQPELDQARTQLEIAQAELKAAQAGLQLVRAQAGAAQAQLAEGETVARDTVLTAPFAGVVIQRNVETGMSINAGAEPQFVLADVRRVKVVFQVSDFTLRRLRIGQSVTVQTAALADRELTGQISSIAPQADAATRLFVIEVSLPNRQSLLRPGMVAAINLPEAAPREVVAVPPSAIARSADDPQAHRVFVVEEQGGKRYARLRRVTLGQVNSESIVITSGLAPGDRVIIGGNNTVRADAEIRFVP